jgi:hypothetical protein
MFSYKRFAKASSIYEDKVRAIFYFKEDYRYLWKFRTLQKFARTIDDTVSGYLAPISSDGIEEIKLGNDR